MKKSELNKMSKDELISLLIEISKLKKENDAFLKSKIYSNNKSSFDIACKKIEKAFSCFELMSLKDARQTLNDFKKTNPNNSQLIELYLHYINTAYKLEETDWRFQENFYSAIEKIFDMIIDILKKDENLKNKYLSQLEKIIEKSNEGWGHREYLKDSFKELE